MPNEQITYRVMLAVLRNPDDALDCNQQYWLRMMTEPRRMARVAVHPNPDAYLGRDAWYYAKGWRRRQAAMASREVQGPAADDMVDGRAFLARDFGSAVLAELEERASEIVDVLERGRGGSLVRCVRPYMAARGHTDWELLLWVWVGSGEGGGLGASGKARVWLAVNLHRLRVRLASLRPHLLAGSPLPRPLGI